MLWWTLPSVFGTIAGFMIGRYATQHMRRPASHFLSATGLLIAWWCLTQWTSMLWIDQDYRTFLAKLQYVGIVSVPVLWFCTALSYSGFNKLLDRIVTFIWIIPVITLLLVFSNEYHQQIWQSFSVVPGSIELDIQYGPWFAVHALYSYTLVIVSTAVLAFRIGLDKNHRFKLFAAVAGPTLVTLVNISFIMDLRLLPIDPTPTAFAAGCLLLLIALRQNMFSVLPVARRYTLEKLVDGVMVIDDQGRIADCNPAATIIFGPDNTRLGQLFADALPQGVDLENKSSSVVQLADGRWLDIRVSGVETLDGPARGQIALVRDITREKIMQETILKTQQELREMNVRLQEQAHTDELTKLANRRHLYERLQEEWSRSSRHGSSLSLVLLDFDKFKDVNDTWGHQTGDRVLSQAAEKLRSIIRPEDLAARHGGEELAIVLPCTDEQKAAEVALRIQQTLSSVQYQNDHGEYFSVTVSAGLATRMQTDKTVDDLVARADNALYHSKHSGRNAISVAGESGYVGLAPLTDITHTHTD